MVQAGFPCASTTHFAHTCAWVGWMAAHISLRASERRQRDEHCNSSNSGYPLFGNVRWANAYVKAFAVTECGGLLPYAAREEVPSKSRNLYGAQAIQICELAFLVLFCQQKLRFCQHGGAIFLANQGLYYKCLSGRTISAFRIHNLKEIIWTILAFIY